MNPDLFRAAITLRDRWKGELKLAKELLAKADLDLDEIEKVILENRVLIYSGIIQELVSCMGIPK